MKQLRWAGIYAICLVVVLIVRVGLWITRYQRIRGALVRPCPADPQVGRKQTVARITRAINRISRLVPDASCLTQTISCQALLSWKGIPSTIAMGVRRDEQEAFKAHAWLIWNDQVVLEGDQDTGVDFKKIHDLPTPVRS